MKQLRKHADLLSCVALFGRTALVLLVYMAAPVARAEPVAPGPEARRGEAAATPVVEYSAGLLSVTAKGIDVRAVVEAIAAKSGVEIVLDKAIAGKVTVDFKGLKFEEGLKAILKEVVEGGFSSEYVKGNTEKSQLELRKVTIVRLGEKDLLAKDAVRLTDITVQDAVGKEVVFAKWGTGENEIPLLTQEYQGKTYRKGFAWMRVDDQGNIYFINWAIPRLFIYDKDGKAKKPLDFNFSGSRFDVDHEGNIYLYDPNRGGHNNTGRVVVFSKDGNRLDDLTISRSEATFTPFAVVQDAELRDPYLGRPVHDFRGYLSDPNRHSSRRRVLPQLEFTYVSTESPGLSIGRGEVFRAIDKAVSPIPGFTFSLPLNWSLGRDRIEPIGWARDNLFLLVSIQARSGSSTIAGYAVALVDQRNGLASFHRILEKDDFLYENRDLSENYRCFDVDRDGNVYQLFSSRDGVHIFRYRLGGAI